MSQCRSVRAIDVLAFISVMWSAGCGGHSSPVAPSSTTAPTNPSTQPVFALSGTVTEPGRSPLQGVSVVTSSGQSTLTDEKGFYIFSRIGRTNISFRKDGYEPRGPLGDFLMNRDTTVDVRLARTIRIATGQLWSDTLFPDDNIYLVQGDFLEGDYCGSPCKLVRVATQSQGELTVIITWEGSSSEFQLWVGGMEGRGSGTITLRRHVQPGEALVYFGLPGVGGFVQTLAAPVTFQLTTSLAGSN